ncbi:MAG TPA: hypothetical protein VLP43_07045 [Solirubrobacteraceae bacterium]|nr:hypothetical protein [Solirubrobacteraceae bacterium]
MSTVTYQTIKLSRGKHLSPEEGACVMELASMLAGEPFSDHPRSVCPVIGSFLRAYNDAVGDLRRQDLYTYAAKVVGSRSSADVQQRRAARLAEWSSHMRVRRSQWLRWLPSPSLNPSGPASQLGSAAVQSIGRHSEETHAAVLALVDELVEIAADEQPSIVTAGGCAPSAMTPEGTIVGESGR